MGKLGPHAERQGFRLILEADDDLPEVSFDRDAIVQVVFNLVDNALKYARSATRKEIVVSCRTDGGNASSVEIAVRDFGPGVQRADLARIFEPFFRREDELTRATKGSGIGLALVKQLVESQGGRIRAENAEDGGFRVSLELRA